MVLIVISIEMEMNDFLGAKFLDIDGISGFLFKEWG